jgi:hypothetical protein
MSYAELIAKALKGRSVNQAAKDWHLQQVTLNRYVRGNRLPDYSTALVMAKEAGMDESEVFRMLADEEMKRKNSTTLEKISANFEALVSRWTPRRSSFVAR